jgi:hypothetical protein
MNFSALCAWRSRNTHDAFRLFRAIVNVEVIGGLIPGNIEQLAPLHAAIK